MPPGITPPLILNYNASTVPILQLALAGKGMSEQEVFDIARTRCARRWSPCPARLSRSRSAASCGRSRSISIRGHAVARPVGQGRANALAAQNQIIPAGTQKIGNFEYTVKLNNAPIDFDD